MFLFVVTAPDTCWPSNCSCGLRSLAGAALHRPSAEFFSPGVPEEPEDLQGAPEEVLMRVTDFLPELQCWDFQGVFQYSFRDAGMVETPSALPEFWKLLMDPTHSDCWCCSLVIFLIVHMTNGGTPRAGREQTAEPSRSWKVTGDPGELGRKLLEGSSGKKHQFGLMIKPSSPRQQAAAPQEGGHLNLKR